MNRTVDISVNTHGQQSLPNYVVCYDMSKEDIMARYLAIDSFMENINDVMKEVDDDRNYGSD